MKLLVLGASSQLGRELCSLLRQRSIEHEAFATDELDLLSQMEVVKTLGRVGPDQVINAAAYSNLEKAETDPEAARLCDIINTQGVSTLAAVCARLEVPLLHHSSSYVFDGLKRAPYKEDDATNPVCRYGMSKWYGERAIRESLEQHVILRTDWMFSVHRDQLFRRHIEACRASGGSTEVMDHRFSPTPADDVARVLLAIALQVDCHAEVWGTYHYCALQPLSEAQFVEHFLREAAAYDPQLAGFIDKLEVHVVPPEKPYIPNSALHCQKIMETFGIKQRSRAAALNRVLEEIYQVPRGAGQSHSERQDEKQEVGKEKAGQKGLAKSAKAKNAKVKSANAKSAKPEHGKNARKPAGSGGASASGENSTD